MAFQGYLDILRAQCGEFTVDNTVNEVLVNFIAPPDDVFLNTGMTGYFLPNDNIRVRGIWVVLPYCFCISNGGINLSITIRNTAAAAFVLPQFGSYGYNYIPVENVETPVDVYVNANDVTDNGAELFRLEGSVLPNEVYISMVNVPDALNEEVLPVYAYARIEHNLQMQST